MGFDPTLLAGLQTLWREVEGAPEDLDRHKKFVAFAVQSDLFLPAIEHYKGFAARGPEAKALAEAQQKKIADAAAAKAFIKSPPPAPRGSGLGMKLIVLLLAVVALYFVARSVLNTRETLDQGRRTGQTEQSSPAPGARAEERR
ncbi:MAG: hypothetical protein U1E65_33225 [Myxococcota bacterium]